MARGWGPALKPQPPLRLCKRCKSSIKALATPARPRTALVCRYAMAHPVIHPGLPNPSQGALCCLTLCPSQHAPVVSSGKRGGPVLCAALLVINSASAPPLLTAVTGPCCSEKNRSARQDPLLSGTGKKLRKQEGREKCPSGILTIVYPILFDELCRVCTPSNFLAHPAARHIPCMGPLLVPLSSPASKLELHF